MLNTGRMADSSVEVRPRVDPKLFVCEDVVPGHKADG